MHVSVTCSNQVVIIVITSCERNFILNLKLTGACVTFQADVETDEVYAQMTLQPLTPVLVLNFVGMFYSL